MCAERARLRRIVGSVLGRMSNGKLAAGILVWKGATAAAREAAMHKWLVEDKVRVRVVRIRPFRLLFVCLFWNGRSGSTAAIAKQYKLARPTQLTSRTSPWNRSLSVSVSRCLVRVRRRDVAEREKSTTLLAGLTNHSSR